MDAVLQPYEFLEHTADIRLCARGKDLKELFTSAALGMMEYLFGSEATNCTPDTEASIELSAHDPESLLIDWLSKLVLKSSIEKQVYVKFVIEDLSETRLMAKVYGTSAVAKEEIKAVTHYDLRIKRSGTFIEATVTFDI